MARDRKVRLEIVNDLSFVRIVLPTGERDRRRFVWWDRPSLLVPSVPE